MNDAKYNQIVKGIKKREKLQKMADDVDGKVMNDNGRTIIHINAFTYITEDGTVVHEWP